MNHRGLSAAQKAELEIIRKSNRGMLKPDAIVDFASDPGTELHKRFEWDDTKAARQYRLRQASEIIRVATIVLPHTDRITRAYVSLPRDRMSNRGYRSVTNVMASTQLRSELLESAMQDMEIFRAKYRSLKELSKVFAAMDSVTDAQRSRKKKVG